MKKWLKKLEEWPIHADEVECVPREMGRSDRTGFGFRDGGLVCRGGL